ncbi:hypothetical protein KEF85_04830 [Methylomonas paludis]|uniref:Uncharacterized protein n=1 Tax=Methylomonas paludis TaxID=1173101 RepID=A0A975MPZ7_9GAMM|nr:hypothetical protein [Methylomonas paludis]QWF71800.1 hypothetical protein KEF85_04830 [Methylomonas paludis]
MKKRIIFLFKIIRLAAARLLSGIVQAVLPFLAKLLGKEGVVSVTLTAWHWLQAYYENTHVFNSMTQSDFADKVAIGGKC